MGPYVAIFIGLTVFSVGLVTGLKLAGETAREAADRELFRMRSLVRLAAQEFGRESVKLGRRAQLALQELQKEL